MGRSGVAVCKALAATAGSIGWLLTQDARPAEAESFGPPAAIYGSPNGFWLIPSDHSGHLYGDTASDAQWSVAQWDIPEDLPPFVKGRSANRFASVEFSSLGYSLEQTTGNLGCVKQYPSGRELILEFDLFVSPNNANYSNFPQARRNTDFNLIQLHRLMHVISINLSAPRVIDNFCKTTQAAALTAIVLTNKFSKQTFYYQLRLAALQSIDGRAVWRLPPASWFFTGANVQSGKAAQFGFGDNITSYQMAPAVPGAKATFRIDALPRLKQLIGAGAQFGMDQNLAHWQVTGTYHGQNAFGHLAFKSTWSNFALLAE